MPFATSLNCFFVTTERLLQKNENQIKGSCTQSIPRTIRQQVEVLKILQVGLSAIKIKE